MKNQFKVYVISSEGKREFFFMEPTPIWLKVVKQAYIRFGTQAVQDIKLVGPTVAQQTITWNF